MKKRPEKNNPNRTILLVFLGLILLSALLAFLLRGSDIAVLNPKGAIAAEQYRLIIVSVAIMLEIAIPTLIFLYYVAWKYREGNTKADYDPHHKIGKLSVLGLWAIPSTVVLLLAIVMWPATHRLEPQKSIVSDTPPMTVQVVAMRWKWLFIYPEQNIATVNFVQVPTDTPIRFELTADEAPMSSFWVPHWSGQLYAMTGHVNPLNIIANEPGDYPGSSAEINGAGFAGMKFIARASSQTDFNEWVKTMKGAPGVLNTAEYKNLLEPSKNHAAAYYASVEPGLYDTILMKYAGSHEHKTEHE